MTKFLSNTILQSGGALLALETLSPDNLPPLSGINIKNELIAIGASVLVSALKFAFVKWIKPIFKKKDLENANI